MHAVPQMLLRILELLPQVSLGLALHALLQLDTVEHAVPLVAIGDDLVGHAELELLAHRLNRWVVAGAEEFAQLGLLRCAMGFVLAEEVLDQCLEVVLVGLHHGLMSVEVFDGEQEHAMREGHRLITVGLACGVGGVTDFLQQGRAGKQGLGNLGTLLDGTLGSGDLGGHVAVNNFGLTTC